MPSMLPLDYTHRASYHEDGRMSWHWFSSRAAAVEWLNRILQINLTRRPSGFVVEILTHDEQGIPNGAKVTRYGTVFEWSKKFNTVCQRIEPRTGGKVRGTQREYPEYYMRKVGPQLRNTILAAIRAEIEHRRFVPIT